MLKIIIPTLTLILFTSACGGGSSSSSNSEANVTGQCLQLQNRSGTDWYVNGCDFPVNFRSISATGSDPRSKDNIQPNETITLRVLLLPGLIERFILCKAPSVPNGDATSCS